jgi:hypothetical protein
MTDLRRAVVEKGILPSMSPATIRRLLFSMQVEKDMPSCSDKVIDSPA